MYAVDALNYRQKHLPFLSDLCLYVAHFGTEPFLLEASENYRFSEKKTKGGNREIERVNCSFILYTLISYQRIRKKRIVRLTKC